MVSTPATGSVRAVTDPEGYREAADRTTARSEDYAIEQVEPSALPEERLEAAARLRQAVDHERVPEDPLTPLEVYVRRMRIKPPSQWSAVFMARVPDGEVAGIGYVGYGLEDLENAHLRWADVTVGPGHRRRGVGRALFRRLVSAVDGQRDDLTFVGNASDRIPAGEGFARAVGATPGLAMKTNQLAISDVDVPQVREWAAISPAGYRLERIDGTVPDQLMSAYLQAANGMNDAPRGDIAFGDWKLTEKKVRDREDWFRKAGIQWWLIVAVHDETGEGAGFTEVTYDPKVAHAVYQQGTATTPAHRGHRIGIWMKAAMLDRVVRERPGARFIWTGNANTNAQMLGINTQLGFKVAWSQILWQVPLAQARKAVGLASVAARS